MKNNTKSTANTTPKTNNSFSARLSRTRSVTGVLDLISGLRNGVSNPKTIRRRRSMVAGKLDKLGVQNIEMVFRGEAPVVAKAEKVTAAKKGAKSVAVSA